MKTIDKNIMIAKMLGGKCELIMSHTPFVTFPGGKQYMARTLKYHSDWKWLMKAVDYIETLNNGLNGKYGSGITPLAVNITRWEDGGHRCTIVFGQNTKFAFTYSKKIDAVHEAVYQFSKFYRELHVTK
ncbi:MAG: hypothetical protein AABY15_02560 [Nanoarchaeota archaeon]